MNLPNFQQSHSLAAILRDVSKWSLADINQAGRSKTVRNTYESIQMNFTFNSRGKIWNCSLFIDRLQAFCERLYGDIKRKLYSGRRENPKVRIKIQVNDDILNASLERITSKWYQRNKLIYEILSNETLDFYIGTKWNEWIMNENGDFAYVVPGTLKFRLTKRNPMVEFKLIGGKCVRSEIKDGHQVVCPWRWQQMLLQKYGPSLIYLIWHIYINFSVSMNSWLFYLPVNYLHTM